MKGNQVIKQSKYFSMSADDGRYVLKISQAFPEDEGNYKCVLKNTAGQVSINYFMEINMHFVD